MFTQVQAIIVLLLLYFILVCVLKTQISNLVRPTRFWNNLHQVHSRLGCQTYVDNMNNMRVHHKGEDLRMPTLCELPEFTPDCWCVRIVHLLSFLCCVIQIVFVFLLYRMYPSVSLHCPFLIVHSGFSNVYCHIVVRQLIFSDSSPSSLIDHQLRS